jgi:hypothetical protein
MFRSSVTTRRWFAKQSLILAPIAALTTPAVLGGDSGPGNSAVPTADSIRPAAIGGLTAKGVVIDDPLDFVFVSEGESLDIRPKGGGSSLMQVQFTRGRSAVDTEDPSKIVVYPYPFLWLTENPVALAGVARFVRRVRQRDGKIYVEIVFGRWSKEFEDTCKAHWMRRNADLLAHERKLRGIDGLEVVVKRPPVIELFIALQDSATGLTLAYAQQNALRGPDELTYSFTFEPVAYDAFLRAEREGDLLIQPIWRARVREWKLGVLQMDAAINLKKEVEGKLESEGLKVDGPVDQLTYDKLTSEILADMKTTIAADHYDLLVLLKSNLLLMEGVLKPDGWMTWDEFRQARGPEADLSLAKLVEPHGLTLLKNKVTREDQTTTTGHETTKKDGGGLGGSMPFFGWSHSGDKQTRDINLVTKATGVEFQEGETKNSFTPHRIKRYRMAEGKEDRGVHQTHVIQIGGQWGVHYFRDSAVRPTLTADVVKMSLSETFDGAKVLRDLLAEKAQVLQQLEAKHTSIKQVHEELLRKNKIEGRNQADLAEQYEKFATIKFDSGRSHGMYEWLLHERKVWGMEPRDGACWGATLDGHKAAEAQAKTCHDELAALVSTMGTANQDSTSSLEALVKLGKEIDALEIRVAALDKQILAAAKQ